MDKMRETIPIDIIETLFKRYVFVLIATTAQRCLGAEEIIRVCEREWQSFAQTLRTAIQQARV